MKSSLLARILTNSPSEAEALDHWLFEREVDKALDANTGAPLPFTIDAGRLTEAAAPHDRVVKAGQIRILSPGLFSGNDALPYVAVLDRWLDDMWLVAPFSPYSAPATDTEMATGIPLAGQGVLQCWNARTAHDAIVRRSYAMGELDEKVRQDALALFRYAMTRTEFPAGFSAEVGAPIRAKADPRREYLAESVARYQPLTEAASKWEALLARAEEIAKDRSQTKFRARISSRRANVLSVGGARLIAGVAQIAVGALAAGDVRRGFTETFLVPAFGVEIEVKHAPDEDVVRLVAYDADGNCAPAALEGFAVVGGGGELVGVFEKGVVVANAEKLGEDFMLLDPDSLERVEIKRKGE